MKYQQVFSTFTINDKKKSGVLYIYYLEARVISLKDEEMPVFGD